MSAAFPTSPHRALKTKPSAWCCARALAVVAAGAAAWAGAVLVLMRASGS